MALKEIVEELESEIYSDVDSYKNSDAFSSPKLATMKCMMTMMVTQINYE